MLPLWLHRQCLNNQIKTLFNIMQKTKSFFVAAIATLSMAVTASAQTKVDVTVDADRGTTTIS